MHCTGQESHANLLWIVPISTDDPRREFCRGSHGTDTTLDLGRSENRYYTWSDLAESFFCDKTQSWSLDFSQAQRRLPLILWTSHRHAVVCHNPFGKWQNQLDSFFPHQNQRNLKRNTRNLKIIKGTQGRILKGFMTASHLFFPMKNLARKPVK